MLRRRLVLFVAALILVVASLGTIYAFQQKPEPPRTGTDSCNCSGGQITAGVAIIHCQCNPGNLSCIVARSTAATGNVATSCK